MNKLKYLYIGQILAGFVLIIIFLKGCMNEDYNWSEKRLLIKGTVKDLPIMTYDDSSEPTLTFTINELLMDFNTKGYKYDDCVNVNLQYDLKQNDTVEITVLDYDYRNEIKTQNYIFSKSIPFYGLKYKEKEYIYKDRLKIRPPNFFMEFLLKSAICIVLIVFGFYKLLDNL